MAAKRKPKLKAKGKISSKTQPSISRKITKKPTLASPKTSGVRRVLRKTPAKTINNKVTKNSKKLKAAKEVLVKPNLALSEPVKPKVSSLATTNKKAIKCKSFSCKQCKIEFSSIGLLRKHQYVCEIPKNKEVTSKTGTKTPTSRGKKEASKVISSAASIENGNADIGVVNTTLESQSRRKLRTKENDTKIDIPKSYGRKRRAPANDATPVFSELHSEENDINGSAPPLKKKRGQSVKNSVKTKESCEVSADRENVQNDTEVPSGGGLQSSMFNKVKTLLSNSKSCEKVPQPSEGSAVSKTKTMQISASNLRKNIAFSLERNTEPIAKKSLPVLTNRKTNIGRSKKSNINTSDSPTVRGKDAVRQKYPSGNDVEILFDNNMNADSAALAGNVKKEIDLLEVSDEPTNKQSSSVLENNIIIPEVITVVEAQNSGNVSNKEAEKDDAILPDNIEPEILTPLQPVKEENDPHDYLDIYDESNGTSFPQEPGPSVDSPERISETTNSKKVANKEGFAFTCAVCQKNFSRKYHLDRHLRISKCSGLPMPTFPCELCNRVYTRKDNLREHLRSHTGEVHRRKNHKCPYCDKAFHGQSLLAIHVRKHTGEKPYACDYCPKKFPSTGALSKHRMTHTGEKPYACNECGRRFTLKGTLSRHLRTHTGIRPHTCTFCGKKFIQVGGLNAHMFFHTGENGFKCDDCGKIFNRKARLQMHQLYVHIKLKPFVCEHCQKSFTRKEDLMRHSVLHTGEKPYKCPTCDRRFSVKPSLKLHLLTHTKEEPRSCHECGRAFIRKDCLLRHMRKRHRDVFDKLLFDEKDEKDTNIINTRVLSEKDLTENIRELLYLLIDEPTLIGFGWPDKPVDEVLELVIQRCGHTPVSRDHYVYMDRLRENAKLLFTVVIDDNAVKTLLNNQTVDEVILHVLRLAKT
ncbi:uncharacterized protein [Parasteatoda tepidariorum]|uniref:uncharacterized protein n=1 Tax=Parasteatoda tepidariorum TaxID=114398 RepID=UPI001C719FCC|nr:uncharacterized protein LOC107449900 [Parasteatoda tepidariorum]XP_042899610.1 uncharacterized protein LOC107449900 [Parasteatoda tepidariorum]XP_042899611.1 uncharacterized protein LOC107449900 [Parasteatoda tepidariorum]